VADHSIRGVAFAAVYVDDFGRAYAFYSDVLGLEKLYDMGTSACFFSLPDETGLYLQGGNTPAAYGVGTMRSAFVFAVESAGATFARLQEAGVRLIHDAPQNMGGDNYWFQFYDPSGNILEVLGPE
jgi:predicted enzyme related to lactoylglutathione lyase